MCGLCIAFGCIRFQPMVNNLALSLSRHWTAGENSFPRKSYYTSWIFSILAVCSERDGRVRRRLSISIIPLQRPMEEGEKELKSITTVSGCRFRDWCPRDFFPSSLTLSDFGSLGTHTGVRTMITRLIFMFTTIKRWIDEKKSFYLPADDLNRSQILPSKQERRENNDYGRARHLWTGSLGLGPSVMTPTVQRLSRHFVDKEKTQM